MSYTYLLLNLAVLFVPLLRSFEPRIRFLSNWKAIIAGIAIPGAIFIAWDVVFTKNEVWGFNPVYLTGISALGLPIEEWLFFITVPYACLFIYEVLNYFVQSDLLGKVAVPLALVLAIVLAAVGALNIDKAYTAITFYSAAMVMVGQHFLVKPGYLGRFFLAYIVSLIPFLIVNGLLTGSFTEDPIVWYNNDENLSIRIFTIPIEDTIYLLLLLILNVMIYEELKQK